MAAAEGDRRALILATSKYDDTSFRRLVAPSQDASRLASVLRDPEIGGFEVEAVLDRTVDTIRRKIAWFCDEVGPRDLALVYLSCHGVLDVRGRLYYTATDTEHELLSVTGLSAAWLNERLEDSRCRRQLLILDCCHSGAFARGAKGRQALDLESRFEARGRIVMTASRATEYAFEGDRAADGSQTSIFTGTMVSGLESGDADTDEDGVISVDDLFDYVVHEVQRTGAHQNPGKWAYGVEGKLIIARSRRGAIVRPVPLPEDLRVTLESPRPAIRIAAVRELAILLDAENPGLSLTARTELTRVAAEDIPRVAAIAREFLPPLEPSTLAGPRDARGVR